MAVRLTELAKELGTTKRDLLERLPAVGFELKKSATEVEEAVAADIRAALDRAGVKFSPPKVVKKRVVKKKVVKKKVVKKKTVVAKPATPKAAVETDSSPDAVPDDSPVAEAPKPPAEQPEPERAIPVPTLVVPLADDLPSRAEPPVERSQPSEPAAAAPRAVQSTPISSVPVPSMPAAAPLRPTTTITRPPAARGRAASGGGSPPMTAEARADARPKADGTSRGRTGAPGRGPVPEQPRTTPKAPRAAFPRPGNRGSRGRAGRRSRTQQQSRPAPVVRSKQPMMTKGPLKSVSLSEAVTVKELSEKMDVKSRDIIKALMERGVFATINQTLEKEVATELASRFGYEATVVSFEEESVLHEDAVESNEDQITRPPVVTVMGHVDHGKTSLLDAIRETKVAAREAGQITQHIGAYQVTKKDRLITFLDTPGHEAFTLMRSRGASVTDIVVLVVAADDGVMPQTIEAIHHAKAANVPIIVAINKIDLPTANPERVQQMLTEHGLVSEKWGGDTVMVEVSAKKHHGLDELLELVLLVADIGELTSNPKRSAAGVVLEAQLDKGRGAVATVLVQRGTLNLGDPFIAGAVYGKVRAMFDAFGERVKSAGPSAPVEILGLQAMPNAGDVFQVVSEGWKARQIGSFRQNKLREQALAKTSRLTLTQLYKQISEGEIRELPVILKGDVQGSVEALGDMLQKLSDDKVKIRIIHSGAGAITETDILLASASNAIVIGFNVRPERKAQDLAEQEKVDIRLHTVIYHVTEEITAAMKGMLEPTFEEVVLGRVEVRQIFRVKKVGVIAGCYVLEGTVPRDAKVRLLRDHVIVYEGKLGSLKRFKDDVAEVRTGYECGMSIANYDDLKENDIIEAFKMREVAPA